MKKGTILSLILAVSLLVAMGGLTVYLMLYYNEETLVPPAEKAESEADAALLALQEAAQQSDALPDDSQSAVVTADPFDQLLIWAGDSRTLGMRDAMNDDNIYIGAGGEGYNWLSKEGLPLIKEAIDEYPDAPVIFNFGVNDYDNMDHYLELYHAFTSEYKDTQFYFLAVNPIDPEVCKNITNEEIADFNAHLKSTFPDTYIDSFTWMKAEEVVPFDGIHYTKEDYRGLYEYTVRMIEKMKK